jgi:hypothetical protein
MRGLVLIVTDHAHVTLSAFLQPLAAAVKSVSVSTWVAAEISEITGIM